MKSLSKMFGVIVSGVLMLSVPGCVVTDLEDPAEAQYGEDSWDDALFDDAVLDEAEADEGNVEQGEGAGDKDYGVLDEEPTDDPWPDPFDPKGGTSSGGD